MWARSIVVYDRIRSDTTSRRPDPIQPRSRRARHPPPGAGSGRSARPCGAHPGHARRRGTLRRPELQEPSVDRGLGESMPRARSTRRVSSYAEIEALPPDARLGFSTAMAPTASASETTCPSREARTGDRRVRDDLRVFGVALTCRRSRPGDSCCRDGAAEGRRRREPQQPRLTVRIFRPESSPDGFPVCLVRRAWYTPQHRPSSQSSPSAAIRHDQHARTRDLYNP